LAMLESCVFVRLAPVIRTRFAMFRDNAINRRRAAAQQGCYTQGCGALARLSDDPRQGLRPPPWQAAHAPDDLATHAVPTVLFAPGAALLRMGRTIRPTIGSTCRTGAVWPAEK
jgi:hypothetical protein